MSARRGSVPQEYLKFIPLALAVYRSQAQTRTASTVSTFKFSIHAIDPTLSNRRVTAPVDELKNW